MRKRKQRDNEALNVYVGVSVYKNTKHIQKCIDSILEQDIQEKYPNVNVFIIVGIDGCPETLEHIKTFIFQPKYDNIRIIYFNENMGTYITSNSLVKMVPNDDDLFIRFDSDDYMHQNMLSEMYKNQPCYSQNSGVLMMKKKYFIKTGAWLPWRCAADTEFRNRYSKLLRVKKLPLLFDYNKVETSLTNGSKYGFGSDYRKEKVKYIEEHKNDPFKPIEMITNNDYKIIKDFYISKDLIIIGIATMNIRKNSLEKMLESIQNQTVKPDRIIIYNNDEEDLDVTDNGKFAYFENSLDEDVYFFSMDDDIYYSKTYIEDTIKFLKLKNNQCIVSYHGRNLLKEGREYYYGHRLHHFIHQNKREKIIDIPGTGVTAFHTSYYKPTTIFKDKRHRMTDLLVGLDAFEKGLTIIIPKHNLQLKDIGHLNNNEFSCYISESNNSKIQNEIADYIIKNKRNKNEI